MDLVAMDGLSTIGTLGLFAPAAILVALVAAAVVRDRRISAREAGQEGRPLVGAAAAGRVVMVVSTVGGLGLLFGF